MIFDENIINIYGDDKKGIPNTMRTDIQEKDGNYLLEIELPGFAREDIQAELVNGKLTIIATMPEHIENEKNKTNFIRKERQTGVSKRSFFVGNEVKQEDITAAFKDGILSIIIKNTGKKVESENIKLIPIK